MLSVFMFFPHVIQASDEELCEEQGSQCVETRQWNFGLSVGLGIRSNPLFESSDIPLIILPEFSYYGEQFFIENLDIGYTLFDSANRSFNLIATPSYDRVFFNRWDPGNLLVDLSSLSSEGQISIDNSITDNSTHIDPNELSNRDFSYLGGFEFSQEFEHSQIQLSILQDITGVHSGKEIRFAYAYSVNHHLKTTLGFTWKDKNLTDYYYGVDENEIVDDRGVYQADASFNPFVRISFNTQTDESGNNWRLSFEYQKLDQQISQSPILVDDYVMTFYAGKRFQFK